MKRLARPRCGSRASDQPSFPAITYGHSTRRDTYETLSAHHPLLFWLRSYGMLLVGDALVRFKSLPVDALAAAGQPAARLAQAAKRAHGAPMDIVVGREAEPPELRSRFWSAVFAVLEVASERFGGFGPAWDRAAANDLVPGLIPTADGPVPIREVFVVARGDIAAVPSDDGRIVVLSDAAAALWGAAGAREHSDATVVGCAEQLGDPLRLRDIFPELEPVMTTRPARHADAVWVRGLVEQIGHRTVEPVLARDSTGLLMIDRQRIRALPWVEGRTQILGALVSFGLLVGDPVELVRELATARSREARARVRAGADLPERLLLAVGGGAAPLLAIFPDPVVEAAGGDLDELAVAALALAVHGPTVLFRLIDVLCAEGLEPPGQWGREDARRFVVELGFPLEFATSASLRREAEVLVSGPVALPDLHDYMQMVGRGLRGPANGGTETCEVATGRTTS